jgi:hypothetical protein
MDLFLCFCNSLCAVIAIKLTFVYILNPFDPENENVLVLNSKSTTKMQAKFLESFALVIFISCTVIFFVFYVLLLWNFASVQC